jgi:hypothetical protein
MWKKIGLVALAALVVFAGGTALGYSHRKVEIKTVVQTVTKTETQTQIEYKDRIVYKYLQAKKKDVVVHEITTKKSDGTVVVDKTITDKTQTDTIKQGSETKSGAETQTVSKTENKTETKEIKSQGLPDWFFHLNGGLSLRDLSVTDLSLINSGVFGVEIDRRILGPCYLGLLGISDAKFGRPIVMGSLSCGLW